MEILLNRAFIGSFCGFAQWKKCSYFEFRTERPVHRQLLKYNTLAIFVKDYLVREVFRTTLQIC